MIQLEEGNRRKKRPLQREKSKKIDEKSQKGEKRSNKRQTIISF